MVLTSRRVVTERPGHRALSGIVEACLQPDSSARRIDLIVEELQRALAERLLSVRAVGRHLQRAGFERIVDRGQLLFGRGENHRDRLQLSDRQDAVLVIGVHDVAGVDQAKAGAARERRS